MGCFVFVAYLIADLCTAGRKFVAEIRCYNLNGLINDFKCALDCCGVYEP